MLDACEGKNIQEGDKIHVFFKGQTELCLMENFDGVYHVGTLHKKLYATIKIFANILDMNQFKNYSLKRNGG